MLCGKSGATWLDRLRTAKGFVVADHGQNPNSPPLQTPRPNPPAQNEDKQMFNVVTDVLNELFNFGDNCSNSIQSKKSARKQTTPRICAFSGSGSRDNGCAVPTLLRSDESNSGVEGVKVSERWGSEGRDASLVGFSRTEVTVIDTSYEDWKLEKLLFRKKNVWKVRDKRGKREIVCGKKKRKMSVGMVEDHKHGGKKWRGDDEKEMAEQCGFPSLNEIYHQTNTSEVHDKHSNKVVGTNKKKQTKLTSENGSSSVILIKSIHAGKKNRTNISTSFLKLKEKKI